MEAHLNKQRGSDLSDVRNEFEKTAKPEPPLDAVIHGEHETRPLPAVLLPPLLLAFGTVAPDRPPHTSETRFDLAVREPLVVCGGCLLAGFKRLEDPVCYDGGGATVLKFVEIGGLQWTGIAQRHEGGDPLEGEDTPPIGRELRDEVGIVE